MTELLDHALEVASRLSQDQQDVIALAITERIEVDARWDVAPADTDPTVC